MSKSKLNLVWRWLPLLLWMAIIFVLSHTPKEDIPGFGSWDLLIKKGSHFLAYALLVVLAQIAVRHKGWAFFIAALYAISDEYHQTFIPGRHGQVADVLIDWVGSLAGLVAFHYYQIYRPGQNKEKVRRGLDHST